ncbi:hypothetical protein RPSD_52220 (plasmid) [Ralstonia solanacearum]|nr:hypothetical protein RPSD_52220 [Ralstonia solanacearum]
MSEDTAGKLGCRCFRRLDGREEVPGFVSHTVVECFKSKHKFLGIFQGSDYRATLAMLRTRLANHLDRIKYGDLARLDAEIERMTVDQDAHNAQSKASAEQSAELLRLLGQVKARKVPLPAQAEAQIRKIADVARERTVSNARRQQVASMPSRQQFVGSTSYYGGSDDFDLWLYLATDFPTSLRTLLLSAINTHHHGVSTDSLGQFSGAGASGTWDDDGAAPSASTAPDAAAAVSATAALEGMAISTDDSLGRFS